MAQIWAFNLAPKTFRLAYLVVYGLLHADSIHHQLKSPPNVWLVPQDVASDHLD
jgi:hypothetical protein